MTIQLYNEGTYSTGVYGGIGVLPTTYDECLDAIVAAPYASTRLRLIALLPSLRGNNNPNYAKGLQVRPILTNASVIQAFEEEIYTFVKELSADEIAVFNYIQSDYIEYNPGIKGNAYSSYVGVYYSEDGEPT